MYSESERNLMLLASNNALAEEIATMDGYNHDANLRVADLMEQNDGLDDRINLDLNPRIKNQRLSIQSMRTEIDAALNVIGMRDVNIANLEERLDATLGELDVLHTSYEAAEGYVIKLKAQIGEQSKIVRKYQEMAGKIVGAVEEWML